MKIWKTITKYNRAGDVLVYCVLLLVNVALWWKYLSGFVLNGDDVYMLVELREQYVHFWGLVRDFSGQYRPMGRLFYFLYEPIKYDFKLVYGLHLVYFTVIEFLFYLAIKNKIGRLAGVLISVLLFANPVFYYHIFTIASDVNLLIAGLLLLQVNLIQKKSYLWTLAPYFLGVFVKETFVVLLPLTLYAIYSDKKIKNKLKVGLSLAVVGFVLGYVYIRFGNYEPIGGAYTYVYSLEKARKNIGNFVAWLINHPRGDQFTFYGFRNKWNYVIDGIYLVLWVFALWKSFVKDKKWFLALLGVLVCSVAPFVFLERMLVFYTDIPLIVMGLMLVKVVRKNKLLSIGLMTIAVVLSINLFAEKWVKYSFVGNSNLIANNYVQKVRELDLLSNKDLCVINHSLGAWSTSKGRLVYLAVPEYEGKLQSFASDNVERCKGEIILRNVDSEYKLLEE